MDREIKFRAWSNVEIVLSDEYSSMADFWLDCRDCKLMQFTGLKDKNGREIYEGDILSVGHLDFCCAVTFDDGCFQLKTNEYQGISPIVQNRANRLEIIGNIYENQELLN